MNPSAIGAPLGSMNISPAPATGSVSSTSIDPSNYPVNVRVFVAVGGVILVIVAILSFFSSYNAAQNPVLYVLNSYWILFGLSLCLVGFAPDSNLAHKMFRHASFLLTLPGLAFFMTYIGSMQLAVGLSNGGVMFIVIGSYYLAASVGVLIAYCQLRRSVDRTPLRASGV